MDLKNSLTVEKTSKNPQITQKHKQTSKLENVFQN